MHTASFFSSNTNYQTEAQDKFQEIFSILNRNNSCPVLRSRKNDEEASSYELYVFYQWVDHLKKILLSLAKIRLEKQFNLSQEEQLAIQNLEVAGQLLINVIKPLVRYAISEKHDYSIIMDCNMRQRLGIILPTATSYLRASCQIITSAHENQQRQAALVSLSEATEILSNFKITKSGSVQQIMLGTVLAGFASMIVYATALEVIKIPAMILAAAAIASVAASMAGVLLIGGFGLIALTIGILCIKESINFLKNWPNALSKFNDEINKPEVESSTRKLVR